MGGFQQLPKRECGEVMDSQKQKQMCIAVKAAGGVQAGVGAVAGAACFGGGADKGSHPAGRR